MVFSLFLFSWIVSKNIQYLSNQIQIKNCNKFKKQYLLVQQYRFTNIGKIYSIPASPTPVRWSINGQFITCFYIIAYYFCKFFIHISSFHVLLFYVTIFLHILPYKLHSKLSNSFMLLYFHVIHFLGYRLFILCFLILRSFHVAMFFHAALISYLNTLSCALPCYTDLMLHSIQTKLFSFYTFPMFNFSYCLFSQQHIYYNLLFFCYL